LAWEWEFDQSFDVARLAVVHSPPQCVHWVDWRGNHSGASTGMTKIPQERFQKIIQGDVLGSVSELQFRDPDHFRAGELRNHVESWEEILGDNPSPQQLRILRWIRNKVSVEDFFLPFRGDLKIILHVDLSLSLYARHCLIGSTLVRYPC